MTYRRQTDNTVCQSVGGFNYNYCIANAKMFIIKENVVTTYNYAKLILF